RVDERGEELAQRRACARALDNVDLHPPLQVEQHRFLAGEVEVEGGARGAGAARDLPDARVLEADRAELVERRLVEALARAVALARADELLRRPGLHRGRA